MKKKFNPQPWDKLCQFYNPVGLKLDWGFKNYKDEIVYPILTNGSLTLLAARTHHGKTRSLLRIARDFANKKKPVLFLTLDESAPSISNSIRWIKKYGGYDIGGSDILVQDVASLSAQEIFNLVREELSAGREYSLIIIDYIQLLRLDGKDKFLARDEIMTKIVAIVKKMAQVMQCPLVAAAQMNRENSNFNLLNKKINFEPTLEEIIKHFYAVRAQIHNLRDGGLEQGADAIIGIQNLSSDGLLKLDISDYSKEIYQHIIILELLKDRQSHLSGAKAVMNLNYGDLINWQA